MITALYSTDGFILLKDSFIVIIIIKGRGFESLSEPEIFSAHFSSSVMAAFASFNNNNSNNNINNDQ